VFKEDRERKKRGGEEGLKADFRLSIMGTWSNRSIEKSANIVHIVAASMVS
jgi:hypothetical protein